jgi:hypothetical protein
VYLCEGQLQGFGKALPSQKYGQSIAQLEEEEGIDEWFEKPWEPIPSSFWISSGIDWEDDFAEGKGQAQALILVETRYSSVFVVSFFLMNEIMMRRGRSVTVPSVATCNEMRKHEAIET